MNFRENEVEVGKRREKSYEESEELNYSILAMKS